MPIKTVELYIKNIILGKKKGLIPCLIKAVLLPVSWLFQILVWFRNKMYDHGWFCRYVPPVPLVLSIGNIVAGGTGKTPVTLLLTQAFYGKYPLAILSRGYRSKAEKLGSPLLICDGHGPLYPASYCGDEPYIFADRFPQAIVIVGGDRREASTIASKAGAQVIILDDAMQHRRLSRDFDLVVVDARDPFGQGYFLPRGFLRENAHALSRADMIILNHVTDHEQFVCVKNQINVYNNKAIIGTSCVISSTRDLEGRDLGSLSGQAVGMFCSIANPDYFKQTLVNENVVVVSEYALPDHDAIDERKLDFYARQCQKKGAQWLVCTEKDKVKLSGFSLALPIAWVQIELKIVEGQEEWDTFINKAKSKIL